MYRLQSPPPPTPPPPPPPPPRPALTQLTCLLQELLDMLHAQVGGLVSPLFRFILRSTLYLSPDPYNSSARRLRLLQREYGIAFQTQLHETEHSLELAVERCFYRTLFETEDRQQLTRTCCCSQDVVW